MRPIQGQLSLWWSVERADNVWHCESKLIPGRIIIRSCTDKSVLICDMDPAHCGWGGLCYLRGHLAAERWPLGVINIPVLVWSLKTYLIRKLCVGSQNYVLTIKKNIWSGEMQILMKFIFDYIINTLDNIIFFLLSLIDIENITQNLLMTIIRFL